MIALRCFLQLAYNIEKDQPVIEDIIKDYFFVGDLLTGAP